MNKFNVLRCVNSFGLVTRMNQNADSNIHKLYNVNIIEYRNMNNYAPYYKIIGAILSCHFADYIQRAMDVYKARYANITFIVFSNEMAWCKQNVRDERNKVVFSPFQHPGHDLAVMSQCDHMIVSVGTFGWWGGWLAGGSVVYFTGYPRPGSEIDRYFVKADYYPPHWIGLP